ncbi:MAG TPA: FlgD immunoglobulin-like domain containing protein, partial [Candidatus Krumholzibacteria bacterium]|nr:FlgD immunoglobulin-like domain containing protein [Candidatus Krumholzibacteria bacterium]
MARIVQLLLLIAILSSTQTLAVTTPPHFWSRSYGGTGAVNADEGHGVAVDATRNVIIVGQFDGTANFGGSDLTGSAIDIFVAKYSPTGVPLWSKKFGSASGADIANGVATDAWGNIFVVGSFTGTVDFGNGVGLVSAGGTDVFLAKYAPNGATLWSRRMGDVTSDVGYAVAVEPSTGSPVITGYYIGAPNFGGGALGSFGSLDLFIAKYDGSSGAHLWSKGIGGTGVDIGNAVAVDASGNVVVTGYFNNSANFGGGALVSAGGDDVFLARYNSGGTHLWSQRFGSTGSDQGYGVGTDADGNVVMAGIFNNTVDFGGGGLVSAGFADIFLAKYDALGTHQWSQRFGASGGENCFGLAVSGSGDVAITGAFNANIDFGGGFLFTTGIADAFLAKFNASGVHQWSRKMGGISNDDGRGVAIDALGNVVGVGRFNLSAEFGGGLLFSNGGWDGYVAKYGATRGEPVISSITDIGNDQGRKVKVTFSGSGADNSDAPYPVTAYEAYRRNDATPVASSLRAGSGPTGLSRRQLLDTGWTFAGSVPSHEQTTYSIDAPTVGDSTIALGQYYSVFFVRAATGQVATFYDSAPDSGYSLDNLAPGIPQNFVFNAGNLSWDESTAADFDYFTVYGANANDFGAAIVVNYSVSPAMDVSASPYAYYYVTATDFSGNEGKPNSVNALSGVNGTPKHYLLSLSNFPNPFNPRTTVSYTVPSKGHVMIRVYDASGAYVATLYDGERSTGAYSVGWDGRGAGGAVVSSGIYFARIQHASG